MTNSVLTLFSRKLYYLRMLRHKQIFAFNESNLLCFQYKSKKQAITIRPKLGKICLNWAKRWDVSQCLKNKPPIIIMIWEQTPGYIFRIHIPNKS